ncbi:hypothetical protein [Actinocorallia sp. A-T 12471]|uniref:DUF7507 domain-containing protein n=1 Tax=Actinocorallia sp. A-T 12471 TaxID=3089813 RepID=UPI0029CE07BB|nr:hypothetical protein [Actinocorallia sp. A-T 12471]MDX6740395.1 hypothetical protein [Actinocorallia sp. A-T 12471]
MAIAAALAGSAVAVPGAAAARATPAVGESGAAASDEAAVLVGETVRADDGVRVTFEQTGAEADVKKGEGVALFLAPDNGRNATDASAAPVQQAPRNTLSALGDWQKQGYDCTRQSPAGTVVLMPRPASVADPGDGSSGYCWLDAAATNGSISAQTSSQTATQTSKTQTSGQTGTQTSAKTGTQASAQTGTQAAAQAGAQASGQAGTQASAKTQASGQVGKQVSGQAGTHAAAQAGAQASGQGGAHTSAQTGTQAAGQAGAHASGQVGTQAGVQGAGPGPVSPEGQGVGEVASPLVYLPADAGDQTVRVTVTSNPSPVLSVDIDRRDGAGFQTALTTPLPNAVPNLYNVGFAGCGCLLTEVPAIRNVIVATGQTSTEVPVLNPEPPPAPPAPTVPAPATPIPTPAVREEDRTTQAQAQAQAAISLVKRAIPPTRPLGEGDAIDYAFTVTNTGDTALTDVAVTDPLVTGVTCVSTDLAVGGFTSCSGSYEITASDVAAGQVVNTATASGVRADDQTTVESSPSTSTVLIARSPSCEDRPCGKPRQQVGCHDKPWHHGGPCGHGGPWHGKHWHGGKPCFVKHGHWPRHHGHKHYGPPKHYENRPKHHKKPKQHRKPIREKKTL